MTNVLLYLLLGLIAGIMGGLFGIGGGIIIIPALVLLAGLTQKMAQGTTLAIMIPPIGLLAALEYYKKGYINFKIAGLVCLGFLIGGYLGAKIAVGIPEQNLRRLFGVFLFAVSLKMIFFK